MPVEKKWKDDNYVQAYLYAAEGMTDRKIAQALGVDPSRLLRWKRTNEAFNRAIEMGREKLTEGGENDVGAFHRYVYKQLPDELRTLWEKINRVRDEENGIRRMEAILEKNGAYARMHLFLYAYVARNFNASAACRAVNITKATFDKWCRDEPKFQELMDEMMWHKKNFFESKLIRKVQEGDISAILFTNRTVNKDRGYNDKHEVEISGQINHNHSAIDVERMPIELRIQVLEWLREERKKKEEIAKLGYDPVTIEGKVKESA